MPVMTAPALSVTQTQRAQLQKMAASTTLPHRKVVQAKALLWAAQGLANQEIARRCEVDSDSVRRWRARFADKGADGVGVIAKGRGRKPALPEGTVAEIVRVTCHESPDDTSTHWTTRSLAKRFGIGKDAIARVWADHNLKPWRVDNFKLSNDPHFEEKLVDVVGLYMNPPARACRSPSSTRCGSECGWDQKAPWSACSPQRPASRGARMLRPSFVSTATSTSGDPSS